MIYLFAGDDVKNKHANYEKFLKSIPKDAETFFINKNDFNPTQAMSLYSGESLFSKKCIVVFLNVLENEDIKDFVLDKLESMGKSKNLFIFLEGSLNKTITDVFKKSRAELNIFEQPKEKKERYNNFLLAYDLERRDKLNLWIHFRQAIDLGVGMEELVGVLFWKAKDMMLKKNFSKFKEEELKSFAEKLSYLLPEARKKDLDAEVRFEEFLLEAF
ncbi:MAG: hypothetical protein WCO07_02490 [bacterium]